MYTFFFKNLKLQSLQSGAPQSNVGKESLAHLWADTPLYAQHSNDVPVQLLGAGGKGR